MTLWEKDEYIYSIGSIIGRRGLPYAARFKKRGYPQSGQMGVLELIERMGQGACSLFNSIVRQYKKRNVC